MLFFGCSRVDGWVVGGCAGRSGGRKGGDLGSPVQTNPDQTPLPSPLHSRAAASAPLEGCGSMAPSDRFSFRVMRVGTREGCGERG